MKLSQLIFRADSNHSMDEWHSLTSDVVSAVTAVMRCFQENESALVLRAQAVDVVVHRYQTVAEVLWQWERNRAALVREAQQ